MPLATAAVVVVVVTCLASCAPARSNGPPVALAALVNASAPDSDVSGMQFCAGVLIAEDRILTAAHCVEGRDPATIDVIVSADNLCRTAPVDGTRVGVASIEPDSRADAAILALAAPVAVEVAVLAPALDGDDVELAAWGWGKDVVGGTAPCRSQRKDLVVVPLGNCGDVPPGSSTDYLCAVPAGDRNTCEGDSGGPLLTADGSLVAITASGVGCGAHDAGSYTRVAPVLSRSVTAG